MGYEVHLQVFEGPFDLLLTLITERRVDVCDVPIATLTEDYLAHLERMRELDLDVTTEFLVVAATLLALKARALLPAADTDAAFDDEDLDRDVLIARLLEVRTFRAAGEIIAERLASGDRLFGGYPAKDDPALRVLPTLAGIERDSLGRVLVEILADRARPVDTSTLLADEISMEDAVSEIQHGLAGGSASFAQLASGRSITWAIALFLAMLELAMRGEVELGQADMLGDIRITLT